MLVQVHAALFPNVRLLAVSEQSTRSATLTVAVTHPGTNLHNCCLTSDSDLTAMTFLANVLAVVVAVPSLGSCTYRLAWACTELSDPPLPA